MKDRPTRKTTAVLLFVLCFYTLSFCALSNLSTPRPHLLAVLSRFCIESDLLFSIAAGIGVAGLLQRLGVRSPWLRLIPVAAVLGAGIAIHAGQANGRDSAVYRDFVTTAFASLPPDAIVIAAMGDDVTGAVFYLHEVERLRPDVIALDSDYLGKPWYTARKRQLHPDLYLPEGVYGKQGWNIKQLLEGNPNRPLSILGSLDDWDRSWKDGYKLATCGLVRFLVRASEFPTYEAWVEWDRRAIGAYDVAPALRAPDATWENGLGRRILDGQVARAHLALVYGSERGGAVEPARYALRLLEDVIVKSGGDRELGIAGESGSHKIETSAGLWKNLGLAYQILSDTDSAYAARFTIACKRFVGKANADDPDLPAARQYLRGSR
jgi:hypothetical protein